MNDSGRSLHSSGRYCPATLACKARARRLDEAARELVLIGRRALQLAPAAIRRCAHASCTQPELMAHGEVEAHEHVWRLTGLVSDVLCSVDASSARVLFGWIVGTTPARRLSRIEQTIVTDVLRRLFLTPADRVQLHLVEAPVCAAHAQWVCELRLSTGGPAAATLQLLTTPVAPTAVGHACRRSLGAVGLPLRAAIAGIPCSLGRINALHPGALLPLLRSQADLAVQLYAGRRYVAAAQLGDVRGSRALRVMSLATSERR